MSVRVVVEESSTQVRVEERREYIRVIEPDTHVLTVAVPGPQGPPGHGMRQTPLSWDIADWQGPEAGLYYLDLYHGLSDEHAVIPVFLNADGRQMFPDRRKNETQDRIRIWVPAWPDCRFAGEAVVHGGVMEP